MYVSPHHPRYAELTGASTAGQETASPNVVSAARPEPPADTGVRLATFPRGKQGGPPSELRLTLTEFRGHPFINARVWTQNSAGDFWPTKAGISIRLREVEDFAEALREAVAMAEKAG